MRTVEIVSQKECKQAYKLLILFTFRSPNSVPQGSPLSKSHGSQASHDITSKISAMWLAFFFSIVALHYFSLDHLRFFSPAVWYLCTWLYNAAASQFSPFVLDRSLVISFTLTIEGDLCINLPQYVMFICLQVLTVTKSNAVYMFHWAWSFDTLFFPVKALLRI